MNADTGSLTLRRNYQALWGGGGLGNNKRIKTHVLRGGTDIFHVPGRVNKRLTNRIHTVFQGKPHTFCHRDVVVAAGCVMVVLLMCLSGEITYLLYVKRIVEM